MTPKKLVLVTGASGYLGGRICHTLLDHGYAVRAFVRRTSDLSSLPAASSGDSTCSLEFAYGDVTDYPSLLAACSGCNVIIHSAAIVEAWLPDPSKFFTVNVGGLENVLRAYKESKTIEKIIFTSSVAAIGPTPGYVADESQVHPEKSFCSEYERSKAEADKIALQAASEGVPIVMLYPGIIYGPGKVTTGNAIAQLIVKRLNGQMPAYVGDGSDMHSLCYVDDVAGAHVSALEKGRPGERYLLTGENVSLHRVPDLVADLTGTSKPRFYIPWAVMKVMAWVSVMFSRMMGIHPLLSPPAVEISRRHWAYSCEKARRELDYHPRSLKEGMGEVLVWLKGEGLIRY